MGKGRGWERVEVRMGDDGAVDEVVARSLDDGLVVAVEQLDAHVVQLRARVGALGLHATYEGVMPAPLAKLDQEQTGQQAQAPVRLRFVEDESEVTRTRARLGGTAKRSGVRMELRLGSLDRSLDLRLDSRGPARVRVVELEETRHGLARLGWVVMEVDDPRAYIRCDIQEDV